MKYCFLILLIASIFSSSSHADEPIAFKGNNEQGGIIYGTANKAQALYIDDEKIRLSPDGKFIFGIGMNDAPKKNVTLLLNNNQTYKTVLKIIPKKWPTQIIKGLPQEKVSPNQKNIDRIKTENQEIAFLRKTDSGAQPPSALS